MSVPDVQPARAPHVELRSFDTLWLQVGGTVCNLACTHCFVSCSPTNHTHEPMSLAEVQRYLDEAAALGVREVYFTGGEPFLNPEMEAILAAALAIGPATVLTNGLLLDPARCARLKALDEASEYSLDLRISLDGWDAASNDPIRGEGTFDRALAGVRNLVRAGLNPVLTVTEVYRGGGNRRRQGAVLRPAALPGDRPSAPQDPAALPHRRRGRTGGRLREAGSACAPRTLRRRAGTTSSAAPAAWRRIRGCGFVPSWSTSLRRRWARAWPTRWGASRWITPPAGPATSTA